jgi:CcmD family protein
MRFAPVLVSALLLGATPLAGTLNGPRPGGLRPGSMLAVSPVLSSALLFGKPPPADDGTGAAPDAGKKGQWKAYDYDQRPEHRDEIPSGTLVVIAYVVLWAVLLSYVVILGLRQRRLRAELAELKREIAASAPEAARAPGAPGASRAPVVSGGPGTEDAAAAGGERRTQERDP